jgi:hypothetical protein
VLTSVFAANRVKALGDAKLSALHQVSQRQSACRAKATDLRLFGRVMSLYR